MSNLGEWIEEKAIEKIVSIAFPCVSISLSLYIFCGNKSIILTGNSYIMLLWTIWGFYGVTDINQITFPKQWSLLDDWTFHTRWTWSISLICIDVASIIINNWSYMCSISKNDQCAFFRCFFPCTIVFCMFRHTSTVIKTASHDLQSFFQPEYFYQLPELINRTPWLSLTSRLSPPVDISRKFCIIIASCIPRKIIQICIASF